MQQIFVARMARPLGLSAEEALQSVLMDDGEEFDDPHEPMMKDSDNDLAEELDEIRSPPPTPPSSPPRPSMLHSSSLGTSLSSNLHAPLSSCLGTPLSLHHNIPHSPDHGTPSPPPSPVTWSTEYTPLMIRPFSSPVGLTIALSDSPVEVFREYFTHNFLQFIAEESNRYARQVMGEVPWMATHIAGFYWLLHFDGDKRIAITGRLLEA